ncbi:AraC family transcriptional regulator [Saccharibacillus alkalitolerans]|uniref:AraC family transcriptional regulator n=1 Tax=Saccharibacillus alkalitolerans TaxID=2705290 RepID=A0ABX0FE32_9BACL|nr:AraC family transcriptional regulator [Saccharibacillus alkalitolerans]NGZ76872.1 AraC family transcriptional regulator [Saccharibacillus alkalitolerans]
MPESSFPEKDLDAADRSGAVGRDPARFFRTDTADRMLENLTVHVSHAFYRAGYFGWNAPEEKPSFNRLYYVTEGEGAVTLDGIRHEPRAGQLFIIPAGTRQARYTPRGNPYSRYFCHFDAWIGDWPLFQAGSAFQIADVTEPALIEGLFEEMIAQSEHTGPFAVLRVKACLLQLLSYCLERGNQAGFMERFMQENERGKLARVLEHIDGRLQEPLEVETLAELVHLHPNYFIPYFKKQMGTTPMNYVQRKRIELARRLLTSTDTGIAAIADRVGMEPAHFSRTFKKATGVSPSAYRHSTR